LRKPSTKPFVNSQVSAAFDAYPPRTRSKLMFLRSLIFETASETEGVGDLEETLKWGEPAYLTTTSKSGSTVRIDRRKSDPSRYAIYFHCQTNLVETFRSMFPEEFTYEGNRAIVFCEGDTIPINELKVCIAIALTYHRRQKALKKA
jgi:hypothetical protein